MENTVSIKIIDVKHFISCLDGKEITAVAFIDGRTIKTKEFRNKRFFNIGEKIKAVKIGKGKFAGYTF